MEHLDPDELVLLALGEQSAAVDTVTGSADAAPSAHQHLRTCGLCRDDLVQLTRTVQLAREAGELGLQAPVVLPASIWNGIAGELGIGSPPGVRGEMDVRVPAQRPFGSDVILADPSAADARSADAAAVEAAAADGRSADASADGAPSAGTGGRGDRRPPNKGRHVGGVRSSRSRSWRRGLLAVAVVVAIGIGIGTGMAIGRREAPAVVALQSQAVLKAMPAGPVAAHGTATVTQGTTGTTLRVAARQLPLRQGYYEVWLYNPQADKMVAVGTLGSGGDGIWTLASTIDLRSYSVVDVSAQDFDGNPAHKDSVLQGPLTE